MAVYVQQPNPHRVTVLSIIIGFHVLMGVGLVTGLAQKAVQIIAPPIVTDIIEEIQQEDRPPPPPPPAMERPPVQVPPPDIVIDIPVAQTNTISNVTDRPVARTAPPAPVVQRVVAPARIQRMPSSEDYYPAASKRAEEQGTVVIRTCVDERGRVIGEPAVVTSSGYSRLDAGAVRLAKAGRYQPGTSDGRPQSESCVSFRVKFEIK